MFHVDRLLGKLMFDELSVVHKKNKRGNVIGLSPRVAASWLPLHGQDGVCPVEAVRRGSSTGCVRDGGIGRVEGDHVKSGPLLCHGNGPGS